MIYITPTPIGNLDDITVRGIKVLSKAKVIFCEDGKITSKLLNLLGIQNKPRYINLVRNNKFNNSGVILALSEIYGKHLIGYIENVKSKPTLSNGSCELSESTKQGVNFNQNPVFIQNSVDLDTDQNVVAIVTDAGTPGISDPAFEIVELLQTLNLDYTVLPGATACIPALVCSNLVSKEFTFVGFLPLKKSRQSVWTQIVNAKYPTIIYESCHRMDKLIEEIRSNLNPLSKVSISQEISKKHENTWIGTVNKLDKYQLKDKGEFVIVLCN